MDHDVTLGLGIENFIKVSAKHTLGFVTVDTIVQHVIDVGVKVALYL